MGSYCKRVTGFYPGVFSIFHPGYVLAFEEARKHCDYLIVGLQTDPTIDRPYKDKPIFTVQERKIILESIKWIDEVIIYTTEKSLDALDATMKYDIRFIGADHTRTFIPIHRTIVYLARDHEWSSTNIRKRICNHQGAY